MTRLLVDTPAHHHYRMPRAALRQTSLSIGCAAAVVLVIAGCGGKGGNSPSTPTPTTTAAHTTTTTTTTAKAGPDLSGQWESSDYECPAGVKHTERVRITQDGTHISAVKTVGDDCVPAGHESFNGTVARTSGTVRYWTGLPGGQPTLGTANVNLTIQNANAFSLTCPATLFSANCNLKFTRSTTN